MDHKENVARLSDLYQRIISDMKSSAPILEELTGRAIKLQTSIKFAVANLSAFLDTLQRLADITTNSKGATREIGCALTRLCLRQRNLENKLKIFAAGISDNFAYPIQDELEDWKKETMRMDKSHAKDLKKTNKELKQLSANLSDMQKKFDNGSVQQRSGEQSEWILAGARQDFIDQGMMAERAAGASLKAAMLEERGRLCTIITCLLPVLDMEVSALNEGIHIQEVMESLGRCTQSPHELPSSSEQVIEDLKSRTNLGATDTRLSPLSPTLSHRSSHRSSLSSVNSSHSSGPPPALPPPAWAKTITTQTSAPAGYSSNGEYLRTNSDQTSNSSSQDSGCVCSASVKNETEDQALNSFMLQFTEEDQLLYEQCTETRKEPRNCLATSNSTNLEEAIRQLELTTAALDQHHVTSYSCTTFPESSATDGQDLPLPCSSNDAEMRNTAPYLKNGSPESYSKEINGSRYQGQKSCEIQLTNGESNDVRQADKPSMKLSELGEGNRENNLHPLKGSKSNMYVESQSVQHSARKAVSSSQNDIAIVSKTENTNLKPTVKPKPMLTPNMTHRARTKPPPPVRRSSSTSMKPFHSPINIDEKSTIIGSFRTLPPGCSPEYKDFNQPAHQQFNHSLSNPGPPALHQTLSIPAVTVNAPTGGKLPKSLKMPRGDRSGYNSDGEDRELTAKRRAEVVAALNKHLAKPSRPSYVTKVGQMKSFSGPEEMEEGIVEINGQKCNSNGDNFHSEII